MIIFNFRTNAQKHKLFLQVRFGRFSGCKLLIIAHRAVLFCVKVQQFDIGFPKLFPHCQKKLPSVKLSIYSSSADVKALLCNRKSKYGKDHANPNVFKRRFQPTFLTRNKIIVAEVEMVAEYNHAGMAFQGSLANWGLADSLLIMVFPEVKAMWCSNQGHRCWDYSASNMPSSCQRPELHFEVVISRTLLMWWRGRSIFVFPFEW